MATVSNALNHQNIAIVSVHFNCVYFIDSNFHNKQVCADLQYSNGYQPISFRIPIFQKQHNYFLL